MTRIREIFKMENYGVIKLPQYINKSFHSQCIHFCIVFELIFASLGESKFWIDWLYLFFYACCWEIHKNDSKF